jgi:hypothetical protein
VETNGVVGIDPRFTDAVGGHYSIPASSPASRQGITWLGIKADLLDQCYGRPPSIGAFEVTADP